MGRTIDIPIIQNIDIHKSNHLYLRISIILKWSSGRFSFICILVSPNIFCALLAKPTELRKGYVQYLI